MVRINSWRRLEALSCLISLLEWSHISFTWCLSCRVGCTRLFLSHWLHENNAYGFPRNGLRLVLFFKLNTLKVIIYCSIATIILKSSVKSWFFWSLDFLHLGITRTIIHSFQDLLCSNTVIFNPWFFELLMTWTYSCLTGRFEKLGFQCRTMLFHHILHKGMFVQLVLQ